MFFDLETSHQNFSYGSDRTPYVKTQDSYPEPLYASNNGFIEPHHPHSDWPINIGSSSVETHVPFVQPPVYAVDGLYNNGNAENFALWAWGPSCYSESPSLSENGSGIASSSSSPTNSSTYSLEDATPSPLQLNELSNVFDFDFSTSLPYDYFIPECQPSPLVSSISRRKSPHHRNLHSPGPRVSRETSPTNSDTDHKRRFPCLILGCERRFTSQYTLKVHMQAHKPKPRVTFPCTLGCSERFSRQHDRLRHEVAKHGKVCEFLCNDCGRFFSTSKTLGNHKCPVAKCGTRWVNGS